jgi:hypothetical protein
MLSKAELKFLIEGKTTNPRYDSVLKYRICQKLLKFQRDDLPALKHNGFGAQFLDTALGITENRSNVTESRNVGENENSPNNAIFTKSRRPGRDLNPRRRLDRPACLVSEVPFYFRLDRATPPGPISEIEERDN